MKTKEFNPQINPMMNGEYQQIARETVGYLTTKSKSVFPQSTKLIFNDRAEVIQKMIDYLVAIATTRA